MSDNLAMIQVNQELRGPNTCKEYAQHLATLHPQLVVTYKYSLWGKCTIMMDKPKSAS